ncbi:hypothetical protein AB0E14_13305, partial [Streptomyces sp. NPDC047981]
PGAAGGDADGDAGAGDVVDGAAGGPEAPRVGVGVGRPAGVEGAAEESVAGGRDGWVAVAGGVDGAERAEPVGAGPGRSYPCTFPYPYPYAVGAAPTRSQHATAGPSARRRNARVRVPRSPGVTG